MTDTARQSAQLRKRVLEIRDQKSALEDSLDSLPAAAQTDCAAFVEDIETVAGALERDIEEVEDPEKGVTVDQVEKLAGVLDDKVAALTRDAEFLSLGSPSTIVCLEEKVMESVDGVLEKASEVATALKDGIDGKRS